jgi:hypothetical protein
MELAELPRMARALSMTVFRSWRCIPAHMHPPLETSPRPTYLGMRTCRATDCPAFLNDIESAHGVDLYLPAQL